MEELNELFYREPYTKEFKAKVIDCQEDTSGYKIVLDDTAFYPEGGGQPSDLGHIDQALISKVKREGGQIVHYSDKPFEIGQDVIGKINWTWRFSNMQNHTVEHIFSGLIHKKLGFDNIGFHMDEKDITVDFSGEVPQEVLLEVERLVNQAILSNIDVNISFPSTQELEQLDYRSKKELSGRVRIVSIAGCDQCACCGTHVAKSGEIGLFKILEATKHRGGTRVRFVAGERALNDYADKLTQVKQISVLLSAKPEEVSQYVRKLLDEAQNLKEKLNQRTNQYFETVLDKLPKQDSRLMIYEPHISTYELKNFATLAHQRFPDSFVLIVTDNSETAFHYVLTSNSPKLKDVSQLLNKQLNGRGGGKAEAVQGSYNSSLEKIRAIFEGLSL